MFEPGDSVMRICAVALAMMIAVFEVTFGQSTFKVPITVTNGTITTTLYLGVNGDGPGGTIQDNTIGVDYDASFGAFQETSLPPTPPTFAFDARFMTIPGRVSTFPTGLGSGVSTDYRGFINSTQIDSFKIQLGGDDLDINPTVLSWPDTLSRFATTWILKPQTGSEWPATDMTTQTSLTLPVGVGERRIIIIKTGASPLPVQLVSFTGAFMNNGVELSWRTISEVNNYGFHVERRSIAGTEWRSVENSFVAGHGTTNEPQNYSFRDNAVSSGNWQYRLKQVDLDGTTHFTDPINVGGTADVDESSPKEFTLKQNYPNPFNPETTMEFSVAVNGRATLEVFNTLGQRVATLFDGFAETGRAYAVKFGAECLPSGVFFYRLQSGTRSASRKLVVTK